MLVPLTNDFDLSDIDQEAKIKDLHEKLQGMMLRRLKRDVIKSLPTKSERILRVEMSAMQTHYYKNILTRNFAALARSASGQNTQISLLNIGMCFFQPGLRMHPLTKSTAAVELKKAANHPYLFDGAEVVSQDKEQTLKGIVMNSGKMVLLDKLLARLKMDGHRVLIFSQMVRILDILSDYMSLRGYQHQRLDGKQFFRGYAADVSLIPHATAAHAAQIRYGELRNSEEGDHALQRSRLPRFRLLVVNARRRLGYQFGDCGHRHYLRRMSSVFSHPNIGRPDNDAISLLSTERLEPSK